MIDPANDRARGALYGQAIGDALGTTQEFTRPRDRRPFPELNLGPQTGLVGGGPFGLEAGQVTDDTQMAVCLADSLAARGRFDAADVARRYVAWMAVAFDIGNQTRASLARIASGTSPFEAARAVWRASGREAAGNGSLMRCSPLPVFFRADPVGLRAAALLDSAITHADPRCRLACAAFSAAIRCALSIPEAGASEMHAAALAELGPARTALATEFAVAPADPEAEQEAALAEQAARDLALDLELAGRPDPALDVGREGGFVRVAFRLAFWELRFAPSFEAAVLDATNRGGDADTNAAITGALYGALAGESRIPAAWRTTVDAACQTAPPAWSERYHPRRLFAAAT
jgi:ADP-ribosylglycohydrolase